MSVPTLEEKWRARTVPTDGGHLEWNGSYGLRWQGREYSPGVIAFRIHTGRDPIGSVRPECGHHRCVQPAHVEDEPGRLRIRTQYRALRGLPPMAALCARDHDQTIHGRLEADGETYCDACKKGSADAPIRLHGTERMRVALALQNHYYAGGSVHGLAESLGRTYGYVHDLLVLADTQFRPRGWNPEFHTARDNAARKDTR